jgi:hypothetical protein
MFTVMSEEGDVRDVSSVLDGDYFADTEGCWLGVASRR